MSIRRKSCTSNFVENFTLTIYEYYPSTVDELQSLHRTCEWFLMNKRNATVRSFNFAQQGATENAQFMIAITVGIFGILAMFLMINHYDTAHIVNLNLKLQNGFLGKGLWAIAAGTILSIAYLGLDSFRVPIVYNPPYV